MKKLFTLILFSISTLVYGQDMSVKSFYLAENDLTANTPGTIVHDQNGNICALIKVESTLDGFSFDVGSLGVSEVKRVGGEIWVYVPYGIRRITLSHPQLGVIRDYQIPCPVEKGRTYVMTLVAGAVRTIVEYAASKQFVYIELNPKDAILEINGKVKATVNGVYQELLPFGKYQYKAYSQNYHDLVGIVEVSNPDNTHTLKLTLKPAFGDLSVLATEQNECAGAAVYIDEKYVGQIPVKNLNVNSGTHSLRIIKDMYEAYNDTFTVSDGEQQVLAPILIPDFAEVTLCTRSDDASIYVNNEFKGIHTWSGKLATGSYIFESRQTGHLSYKISSDVSRNDNGKTFIIDDPIPIYGSLVVSSTPSNARILIDGIYVGETPKYLSRQIIGEHSVCVELEGYKSQTNIVDIKENVESSLDVTLEKRISETHIFETTSNSITIGIAEKVKINTPYSVIFWESDSPSKAVVDDNGIVTGISEGVSTLWAHISDGNIKMYKINVSSSMSDLTKYSDPSNNKSIRLIRIEQLSTYQLYVVAGNHKVIKWESENLSVATVNTKGVVSGIARGTAVISAHLENGDKNQFTILVY